ncbi:hypothetical protein CQ011_10080 [Arthrobacter sp. MYb213]|nr:hypothetical protein CQ011_10080 [Arthrobacter sp. MYb213]
MQRLLLMSVLDAATQIFAEYWTGSPLSSRFYELHTVRPMLEALANRKEIEVGNFQVPSVIIRLTVNNVLFLDNRIIEALS